MMVQSAGSAGIHPVLTPVTAVFQQGFQQEV